MSDFYKMFKENEENEEDALIHYGIKGMKWGKHKSLDDYLKGTGSAADRRNAANAGRMIRYGRYEDPALRERIDLKNRTEAERMAGAYRSNDSLQQKINEGEYNVRLAGKKTAAAAKSVGNDISNKAHDISTDLKGYARKAERMQIGGVNAPEARKAIKSTVSKAATKSYSAIKSAYNSNECKSIRNKLGSLANKGFNKAKKGITSLFD